jgi:hypothetical protein
VQPRGSARPPSRPARRRAVRAPRRARRLRRCRPRSGPRGRNRFHARLCASATPVLPPKPPVGGMTCAASPARKTRPCSNVSAVAALAFHGWTLSTSTATFSSPSAVRTSSTHRSAEASSPTFAFRAPSAPNVANTAKEHRVAAEREPEETEDLRVVDVDDARPRGGRRDQATSRYQTRSARRGEKPLASA